MPKQRVGDTPVQLAQSGARGFLVRNVGTVPVYLEEGSTVSASAYGLELQPLDSANWPPNKSLWIASAQGTVGEITVLYGAEGVSLGAVSAVVTGDVTATIDGPVDAEIIGPVTVNGTVGITGPVTANISGTVPVDIQNATIDAVVSGDVVVSSGTVNVGGILTPVVIQGGGQALYLASHNINPGASVVVPVPVLASGQTFYAYQITVQIAFSQHATSPRILRYQDSFGNRSTLCLPPVVDSFVGAPYIHTFTIPALNAAAFFNITLTNIGGIALTGSSAAFLEVTGVNVSPTTPTTNTGQLLFAGSPGAFTPPTAGAAVNVWVPPTYQSYHVLMRTSSTAAEIVGMSLSYLSTTGALELYAGRAYNTGVNTQNIDPVTNNFVGAGNVYIPISGNGKAAQIAFPANASNSQGVNLALV